MRTRPRAILIIGSPLGGKTTYAKSDCFRGFEYLDPEELDNDPLKVKSLLHTWMGHEKDFIIDACHASPMDRKIILDMIRAYPQSQRAPDYRIEAHWIKIDLKDVIRNGASRQFQGGPRLHTFKLMRYRKSLEEPTEEEGFHVIIKTEFKRREGGGLHRSGLFFSLLSVVFSKSGHPYPTTPEDVGIFPEVNSVFERYSKEGYILIGVANIPLVGMKRMKLSTAQDCMLESIKQITAPVDQIYYSPHRLLDHHESTMPKPLFAFKARDDFGIRLPQSVMVGSTTTDKEFAQNAGIGQYLSKHTFFYNGRPRVNPLNPVLEVKRLFNGVSSNST